MATRSVIAKLDSKTKKIKAVYCHNDGYLSNNGKILDQHYQDEDKVDELLAHGDVSSLDENIGEKINFDDIELRRKNKQCMFYDRDRGEKNREAITLKNETELLEHAFEYCDAEYVYMFAYGSWYVYDNSNAIGDSSHQFIEIDEALYTVYKNQLWHKK